MNINFLFEQWSNIEYGEISALLSYLMFLKQLHHSHHWIVSKKSFYSNHLLFQRLYEKIDEEIDLVAEKAIGLGSIKNINQIIHSDQVQKLFKENNLAFEMKNKNDYLIDSSLYFESHLLLLTNQVVERLKQKNLLTRGLDNMIAGIEDTHESHGYLLSQALNKI